MLTAADGSYRMCLRPHTYLVSSLIPEDGPLGGLTPIGRAFQVPLVVRAGGKYTGINFGYARSAQAE